MTVTKAEYAEHRGVTPSAVSMWISRGHLSGAAIVGEGRAARIDVDVADEQIAANLDLSNSAGRSLTRPAQPPKIGAPADDHAARYQKAKADQAEIAAEEARRRQFIDRGIYVRADATAAAMAREVSDFIVAVEQGLGDLVLLLDGCAGTVKEKTVIARQWCRKFRAKVAAEASVRAQAQSKGAEDAG